MTLAEFLAQPYTTRNRPPLRCKDGFELSVQASEAHYCTPHSNRGPWTTVEVGYPSAPLPQLCHLATVGSSDNQLYGYVPLTAVQAVIDAHGGIAEQVR